jgi:hypothetical protein
MRVSVKKMSFFTEGKIKSIWGEAGDAAPVAARVARERIAAGCEWDGRVQERLA